MKRIAYNKSEDFSCYYDGRENVLQAVNDHSLTVINVPPEIGGYPVDAIGNGAFQGCHDLKWVKLPNSVKSIGNNAFKDCVNLKEVNLGSGVEKIGAFAFGDCANLRTVILSNHVRRIEMNSFRNCRKLTKARVIEPEKKRITDYAIACESDNAIWMYLRAVMRACDPRGGYMDKYDATFLEVADEDDIYRIAVQRLRNPYDMTEEMESIYRSRLSNMVKAVILNDRVERLTAIGDLDCIDDDSLEYYIELASRIGGGCIAYLLEHKFRKSKIGLDDFSL